MATKMILTTGVVWVRSFVGASGSGGFTLTSGQFLAPNGSVSAPSYSFVNDSDTGLYSAGSGVIVFAGNTTRPVQIAAFGLNLASDNVLAWTDTAGNASGTQDLILSRGAANRLDLASGDSFNIVSGQLMTAGAQLLLTNAAYGVGTAYAFTNTAAAIDFGTTDPSIVLTSAGTYLIFGQVHMAYAAATVTTETATIKVRRTNNTAADLSAVVVIDLPVATTLTNSYGIEQIPPFVYTTSATNDAVTLFANVSATLGAGTINATAIGTSLVALRIA